MVDVIDMRLNDVVQLIRGKAGSIVRLGVVTEGESKTVQIVRDRIELKDSEARGEIISSESFPGVRKANGAMYRVGVIKLPSFYMDMTAARRGLANFKSTTRDVRRILYDFKQKGIDAVVLDLRFNGGGSLTEAINLTGLFIDTGPVVQVKDPTHNVQKYDDVEPGTVWSGPLVIVTNKFSASASEILAGAVQDYKRGIVIGDKTTHGKGTVQSLLDLSQKLFPNLPNPPKLGALKITMQQFYRPNGDSTQKRGVVADVQLPSTTNEMDIGEADLDYAINFDTVPLADHATYPYVRPDIVSQLNARLQTRIAQSEDFGKEMRRIERYKEQKERDYVSLNEEEFFARRKELNAEKEDKEKFEEIDNGDDVVIDLEDFYDKEIVAVTLDYVELLQNTSFAER
jgi:carboxyl-terminal processing protease